MPILFSAGSALVPTTTDDTDPAYASLEIGKPLAIQLLTFFPGKNIQEWGGKAEILISSELRVGPRNEPAPRFINMFLRGYPFRDALPITEWGGDVFGDPMMYYAKAYAGQEVRMTLRGVEVDRVGKKTWEGVTGTITSLGSLALFAAGAQYLAAAGLLARVANTLTNALVKNDKLAVKRQDFSFDQPNRHRLKAGRYLMWKGGPTAHKMRDGFRLAGDGDENPNSLVQQANPELRYDLTPYFVLQVDGSAYPEYDNFAIGRGSAALLEEWGDVKGGAAQLFNTVQEIAAQVNDAKNLGKIANLTKRIDRASSAEEREKLRKEMAAYTKLFSDDNSDFMLELLTEKLGKSP